MSIANEISRLNTAKADIKTALEGKGIPVPSTLKIDGYAELINDYVIDIRVIGKVNVTDTSKSTTICNSVEPFSAIEIDGVVQPSVVTSYTFTTTGEHTVKYTLVDPTSIGDNAFSFCTGLISITIPNSVTSIGDNAFASCNFTSITIPNSVTSIGTGAFRYSFKLTSIIIPDSVTNIGTAAFNYCPKLTSVTIGNSVTSIGYNAFYYCSKLTYIISNATIAPTITNGTFQGVKNGGTLIVPNGSSGYDTWMQNASYYLGLYGWTKVEQ